MTPSLHGTPKALKAGDYTPSEAYAEQGDTRVIRDLLFGYTVQGDDGTIFAEEARRDEVVTVDEIGTIALQKGERHNSFYTDDQLARRDSTGSDAAPVEATANLSELGEHELAEWLETANPDTGRAWSINDVLEQVGDDKALANRMLAAENIRSAGDPRAGLEKGLTEIIQGDN